MARGRSETLLVTRVTTAGGRTERTRRPDRLIVEEPLSIQLDGQLVTTTMRTPGHDYELAVGFCVSEGLLSGAPVTGVRYCADGSAVDSQFNVVTVETSGLAPPPTPRLGVTSSSCGLCGSDQIDLVAGRLAPLDPTQAPHFDPELLLRVPELVLGGQGLFESTGAVHAAAAFSTTGEVVAVREDVGRHNAVDKVVGRLHLDGALPARSLGLFVSGRASFEIVTKAWSAGFGVLVAVSAPTALAAQTARRAGMVLAGFVRDGRMNIYAPERWTPDEASGGTGSLGA
jgi:FdhD protein